MSLLDDARIAAPQRHAVRRAMPHHGRRMVEALSTAFYDDPVFRHFVPDDRRRAAVLPGFFAVFVDAYLAHGEAYVHDAGAGAALWAYPGRDPIAADEAYARRLEAAAGIDAPRLFAIIEAVDARAPREPYHHLQFLGVRPERQREGIGGALMAPVLGRCDRHGAAAYLEATSDRNRALYERHGFRAHGDIPLGDGPVLWGMWREPRA